MSFVIASYQARPGREQELDEVLSRHYKVLDSQGLVSGKPPVYFKTPAGYRIEILEWKDQEASTRAHVNPAVKQIWDDLGQIAEFKSLKDLDISERPFPHCEGLDLAPVSERSFGDTMMSTKNYDAMISFYERFLGLKLKLKSESYAQLEDTHTGQKLCLTKGPSVEQTALSIETASLDTVLRDLKALGGSVKRDWEYERMRGVNATDPEGNELLLFEMKP
jgi:catechol 2,3-dioxygenase-like lactoylglutathione lyase family enzyme